MPLLINEFHGKQPRVPVFTKLLCLRLENSRWQAALLTSLSALPIMIQ